MLDLNTPIDMEKVPEQFEPGNPREAKPDHYVQFVAPMIEILMRLAEQHRDAYELLGGDDMYWHLDETPLSGTGSEAGELGRGLRILQEFAEIAADIHSDDRLARLEQKVGEFQKAMYGL